MTMSEEFTEKLNPVLELDGMLLDLVKTVLQIKIL